MKVTPPMSTRENNLSSLLLDKPSSGLEAGRIVLPLSSITNFFPRMCKIFSLASGKKQNKCGLKTQVVKQNMEANYKTKKTENPCLTEEKQRNVQTICTYFQCMSVLE